MIDRVTGTLLLVEPGSVVLDLHGLGLRVEVSPTTGENLGAPGHQVTLLTELAVVGSQDPRPRLFGFRSAEERQLFLLLRSVSGIGPATAMRLLGAQPTAGEVAAAIAQGDAGAIKVKGVGPKTAKRVINELKDKALELLRCLPQGRTPARMADRALDDALLALKGLEFDPQRARELLSEIRREAPQAPADELVRAVLQRA